MYCNNYILDDSESFYAYDEQISETLVIHIQDYTTDFLSAIYDDKGWDIITDPYLEPDDVADAIIDHERVVLLGHGSPAGLIGGYGFIVDDTIAPLLMDKQLIAIWCNADLYVKNHGLKGFYSGMFISETSEAEFHNISADKTTIDNSNILFASALGEYIDSKNILENVKREYRDDSDPIINFNRKRLYSRK